MASIKMDLKERVCEGVKGIYLAEDRDQWLTFVSKVAKLWAPQKAGNLSNNRGAIRFLS
jgi:hypothetical protein